VPKKTLAKSWQIVDSRKLRLFLDIGIRGGRVAQEEEGLDEFVRDLEIAQAHALRAVEALLRRSGPKRSLLYQTVLVRAQRALTGLYTQELQRRKQRGSD
jgi:hypothetical protein